MSRENIIFMALSADTRPHFTTLSDLISRSPEAIADLFGQIVLMCDELGLVGKEDFAIDGCKLRSNAFKEWRGTYAELKRKRHKIDRAVRRMLRRHRGQDSAEQTLDIRAREQEQIRKLRAVSRKSKGFLDAETERKGVSGRMVKSNITDNGSAKIKTSHSVIQGYTGAAAVDSKHQVVAHSEAFGQGQEHGLIKPVLEGLRGLRETFQPVGREDLQALIKTRITADSGYHNREVLEYLETEGIDAYLADTGFGSRDPRFKDHKTPKERNKRQDKARSSQNEFVIDRKREICHCPAGRGLLLKARRARIGNYLFMQFQGYEKDCNDYGLRKRCLRNPNQHIPRQINVALAITREQKAGAIERMKRRIDSSEGRHIYTVSDWEPWNRYLGMLPMLSASSGSP